MTRNRNKVRVISNMVIKNIDGTIFKSKVKNLVSLKDANNTHQKKGLTNDITKIDISLIK